MATKRRIVIVGGGFAGLSTAYHLSKMDEMKTMDIVVLEQEDAIGVHSSGRSAQLCRQLASSDITTEFTTRGAAFLRRGQDGDNDVGNMQASRGKFLRKTGSILTVDSLEFQKRLEDRSSRHDIRYSLLDRDQVLQRLPNIPPWQFLSGLYFPDDGVIDAKALLHFYYQTAVSNGVRVVCGVEVQKIETSGRSCTLTTNIEQFVADCVVNAAGAWAAALGAMFCSVKDFSVRGRHIFIRGYEELAAGDIPYVWHVEGQQFYFRKHEKNMLVCVCDSEEVAPGCIVPITDSEQLFRDRIEGKGWKVDALPKDNVWIGTRTFAKDEQFFIDWDDRVPGLFWVAGLGGHGVTSSYSVGETAANKIFSRLGPRI